MADNVLFYDPLLVNTKTNKVSLEKEMQFSDFFYLRSCDSLHQLKNSLAYIILN